ncbi:MAG: DEAD/DEAH box helicase [Deltaproteobacteria bacterium]|nr:DEAD/DEAH box helicase [Deltaproteobacteria bacterium]
MPHSLPTEHAVPTTQQTFAELGVSGPILSCLDNVNFVHPTPIQAAVIPTALQGKDVIGCAQTGTGKTAAFAIPLAERLGHGDHVRGLILCPTRELAMQTQAFLELFGENHHLTSVVLIGGVKIGPQLRALQQRPDIVVATPGRLFDHLERKSVRLERVTELVFDEADRMLDMGFLPQIEAIMRHVPKTRHTMMFSATMPSSVERMAHRYLHEPQKIMIAPSGTAAAGIEHRLYLVDPLHKLKAMVALLNEVPGSTLVFVRMRNDVDWMARALSVQAGVTAERMHADRNQNEREAALAAFREGNVRVLVATDLAARGLDVPEIAHVVQYDLPEQAEDYIHRAGRTARFASKGIASAIATWMDKVKIGDIERLLGNPLPRCTLSTIPAWIDAPAKSIARLRPRMRRR